MKIQNLILPTIGICSQEEMYFRRETGVKDGFQYVDEDHTLIFFKYGRCYFDTYFNGFTLAKWKKYTIIQDLSLCLDLKGSFEVTLLKSTLADGRLLVNPTSRIRVYSKDRQTHFFPYKLYDDSGILSFSLKALEDGAVYYGGWYDAQIPEEKLQEVKIAVNICTFKREPFILRNIDTLNHVIFQDPENPLYKNLRIYVSDNGQTLHRDKLNDQNVRIVPNKNVGGAGGFSRGLIEIMDHMEEFPATHALMMDDDVVIEPESLFRTYMLLRCRKEEYQDMFVGGAMLKLDMTNIQVESGAYWNAGRLHSNKANLDMNVPYNCALNEMEEYTEFNAWWYCCTPMTAINDQNLPLPIFIRGDDVEYGLRNMKTLVLLNGICVWHEAFENKYSSFLSYYILRNMLYDNSIHEETFGAFGLLAQLYRNVVRELVYYRYKNIDLLYRGVNDYFKGVDFLKNTDGETLHKEIMGAGYKAQTLKELGEIYIIDIYRASKAQTESRLHKLLRYVTANGYLLPARRMKGRLIQVVPVAQCRPINFFRHKKVLNYDPVSGKGFVTEKSLSKALWALIRLAGMSVKCLALFPTAKKKFQKEVKLLTTKENWDRYLGM